MPDHTPAPLPIDATWDEELSFYDNHFDVTRSIASPGAALLFLIKQWQWPRREAYYAALKGLMHTVRLNDDAARIAFCFALEDVGLSLLSDTEKLPRLYGRGKFYVAQ